MQSGAEQGGGNVVDECDEMQDVTAPGTRTDDAAATADAAAELTVDEAAGESVGPPTVCEIDDVAATADAADGLAEDEAADESSLSSEGGDEEDDDELAQRAAASAAAWGPLAKLGGKQMVAAANKIKPARLKKGCACVWKCMVLNSELSISSRSQLG